MSPLVNLVTPEQLYSLIDWKNVDIQITIPGYDPSLGFLLSSPAFVPLQPPPTTTTENKATESTNHLDSQDESTEPSSLSTPPVATTDNVSIQSQMSPSNQQTLKSNTDHLHLDQNMRQTELCPFENMFSEEDPQYASFLEGYVDDSLNNKVENESAIKESFYESMNRDCWLRVDKSDLYEQRKTPRYIYGRFNTIGYARDSARAVNYTNYTINLECMDTNNERNCSQKFATIFDFQRHVSSYHHHHHHLNQDEKASCVPVKKNEQTGTELAPDYRYDIDNYCISRDTSSIYSDEYAAYDRIQALRVSGEIAKVNSAEIDYKMNGSLNERQAVANNLEITSWAHENLAYQNDESQPRSSKSSLEHTETENESSVTILPEPVVAVNSAAGAADAVSAVVTTEIVIDHEFEDNRNANIDELLNGNDTTDAFTPGQASEREEAATVTAIDQQQDDPNETVQSPNDGQQMNDVPEEEQMNENVHVPEESTETPTEEVIGYMNPRDKVRFMEPVDINPLYAWYFIPGDTFQAPLIPGLRIAQLVPDGVRVIPVPEVQPLQYLESGTSAIVDEKRVLAKRKVRFVNELHKRIETEKEITDLEGLILHDKQPTDVVRVERKHRKPFAFVKRVLKKLKLKKRPKMKSTEGLRSAMKKQNPSTKAEDGTGLRRYKSCITLDSPELDGDEERPKIFQRVNRPQSA